MQSCDPNNVSASVVQQNINRPMIIRGTGGELYIMQTSWFKAGHSGVDQLLTRPSRTHIITIILPIIDIIDIILLLNYVFYHYTPITTIILFLILLY